MKIDKDLYEKVQKITLTDYKAHYTKDPDDDFVWIYDENIIDEMLDDLLREIDYQKEKIEDIEQDRDDNYVPRYKDKYEEYGMSEKDFY